MLYIHRNNLCCFHLLLYCTYNDDLTVSVSRALFWRTDDQKLHCLFHYDVFKMVSKVLKRTPD